MFDLPANAPATIDAGRVEASLSRVGIGAVPCGNRQTS